MERAVALRPNWADPIAKLGQTLGTSGRPREGIPLVKKAILLDPFNVGRYYIYLGIIYRIMERYEEGVSVYEKAVKSNPNSFFAHLELAACLTALGRKKEARAEVAEVLRINPHFSLKKYAKVLPAKDPAVISRYIGLLRQAGLPE